ncbi:hypothetical protein [Xanthomonas virus PB119]|nr:hypothetical protein [Xanthomonas virus PB119]
MKKHYFLACAQVAWRADAETENVQVMPVNGIAAFDQPFIRQYNLAQINGQLINNLSQMIGEPVNPELVAGVTIMSINSLGYMSEDEFRAQPSQTKIEEEVRSVIAEGQAEDAAAAQAGRA